MSENLILVEQVCLSHHIDTGFITTLESYGLVELIAKDNTLYLDAAQLAPVEKMIRLHYELEINPEGIDVIANLLRQIEALQRDLAAARNRLRLHGDRT